MRFLADIILIVGAGAVTYAAWRLDPTAGIMTGGVLMLVAGLALGRAEAIGKSRGLR